VKNGHSEEWPYLVGAKGGTRTLMGYPARS
jgi:hypothetical protein